MHTAARTTRTRANLARPNLDKATFGRPGFDEHTLDGRFEAIAAQQPNAIAIEDNGTELTYAELDARANAIANRIRAQLPSVSAPVERPDQTPRIGVYVPQGPGFIAAVLGVLKSGAAFVPLDPSYPDVRNAHMLEEAEPLAIVCLEDERARLGEFADSSILRIDAAASSAGDRDAESGLAYLGAPDLRRADRLAYVLFTSGSTGRPKGVMHTHRNVLHNAHVHGQAFRITPEDRQTLVYPCSVYGGIRDIFNALMHGASLHHYPVRTAGYDGLPAWLAERKITIYCSVASVFRHMARQLDASGPPDRKRFAGMKIIKLGGEAPREIDVELYRKHFPDDCELSCGLGSTETGMTCRFPVTKETTLENGPIPLGEPVLDTEVLLVDPDRKPLENPGPGEIGEIAIRSRFITKGYLGRDELNAEVFSIDPEDPSLRTFYTGDLAERNSDNQFVHRGRKDNQVKIRGNRVELLEVEAAVESHPDIRDAVVMALSDEEGRPYLASYITLNAQDSLSVESLREYLAPKLPSFAIPGIYAVLAEIPLTPNGKRNRRALPDITGEGIELLPVGGTRVEPANETERLLLEAFNQVLSGRVGAAEAGVTDGFFSRGGDSLQAVALLREIERTLGARLELSTLVSNPTPRAIAERLADVGAAGGEGVLTFRPISDTTTEAPVFGITGRGGSALCFYELVQRLPETIPFYGLQLPGVNEGETPFDEVEPLATELIHRIREVAPEGPYRLLGYSFGATVAYEMTQQLHAMGETVEYLCAIDSQAPGTRRPVAKHQALLLKGQELLRADWDQRAKWIKSKLQRPDIDEADREIANQMRHPDTTLGNRLRALGEASRIASERYRAEPQDHTPVTLLRCELRHDWLRYYEEYPDHGWGELAPVRAILPIPGRHLEVFELRHTDELAAQVAASMAEIGAPTQSERERMAPGESGTFPAVQSRKVARG